MCAVSNVGDHFSQQWPGAAGGGTGVSQAAVLGTLFPQGPTRAEFDDLRKTVLDMKEQLLKAKEEDIKNGEPDCEMEEKVKLLKAVAEAVGVSLDEVFKRG